MSRLTLISDISITGLSAWSDISQGSVATHLRCGKICSDSYITNCLLILTVKKKIKNRLIFGKIIRCTKMVPFLAHPVYSANLEATGPL